MMHDGGPVAAQHGYTVEKWAARLTSWRGTRAITVPPAYHDGVFLARRASVCGRVVRAGRARIWRRYGHITVGETGADPARYGVFAPHSHARHLRPGAAWLGWAIEGTLPTSRGISESTMRRRLLVGFAALGLSIAGCAGKQAPADRILSEGESLFNGRVSPDINCYKCHNGDGSGTWRGPDLAKRVPKLTDQKIVTTIMQGPGFMPSFKGKVSDAQAQEIA